MGFRIQPHMRLHEWVADEAALFRDEGLVPFLDREQIALQFAGRPYDRLRLLLDGSIAAANAWGAQYCMLEQRGFRKLVLV